MSLVEKPILRCFDYFLIVRLTPPSQDSPQSKPIVLQQFPEGEPPKNFKQLLQQAPLFCFPDAFSFPRKHMATEEKFFSFIVTDLAGYKRCVSRLCSSSFLAFSCLGTASVSAPSKRRRWNWPLHPNGPPLTVSSLACSTPLCSNSSCHSCANTRIRRSL